MPACVAGTALITTLLLSGCVAGGMTPALESASFADDRAVEIGEPALAVNPSAGSGIPAAASEASPEIGPAVDAQSAAAALAALPAASIPVPLPAPLAPGNSLALAPAAQDEPATMAIGEIAAAIPSPSPAVPEANPVVDAPAQPAPANITTASLQPQPERKPTLFELLFQKRTARTGTQASAQGTVPQPATAVPGAGSGSQTATANTGTALPGVASGSELFGITEGEAENGEDHGGGIQLASAAGLGRLLSAKGFVLQTSEVEVECFKPELVSLLNKIGQHYGKKVMVTSGYRSPDRNRQAGGAKNSTHIYCKAADIQIEGVNKWDLAKYLRTLPERGGVGTYCRTESVHIDIGTQRDWHYPCRRTGSAVRQKKA